MSKTLKFTQIIIAVIIGIFITDVMKGLSRQCLSRDVKGRCTETRIECIWNSRMIPSIIPSCFFESDL